MDDAREILAAVAGGSVKPLATLNLPEILAHVIELDDQALVAWTDGPRSDFEVYDSAIDALDAFARDMVERTYSMICDRNGGKAP